MSLIGVTVVVVVSVSAEVLRQRCQARRITLRRGSGGPSSMTSRLLDQGRDS